MKCPLFLSFFFILSFCHCSLHPRCILTEFSEVVLVQRSLFPCPYPLCIFSFFPLQCDCQHPHIFLLFFSPLTGKLTVLLSSRPEQLGMISSEALNNRQVGIGISIFRLLCSCSWIALDCLLDHPGVLHRDQLQLPTVVAGTPCWKDFHSLFHSSLSMFPSLPK